MAALPVHSTQLEEIENQMEELSVTTDTKVNQSIVKFAEGSHQLIPGLPDDIALAEIATKLPWSNFHILPTLSRGWQQAIREKEPRLAETLVVFNTESEHEEEIFLYSTRDRCSYRLPFQLQDLIANGGLLPFRYKCVSLDGKIYFVAKAHHNVEVYALDMAVGKRQWKQCASTHRSRHHFACGVFRGKLYVFGGLEHTFRGDLQRESEVYDPQSDSWTLIAPLSRREINCHVATIGEEMFLYDRMIEFSLDAFRKEIWPGILQGIWQENRRSRDEEHGGLRLDVYHPGKNVWRIVEPFGRQSESSERVFVADGKFYSMSAGGIHVHDDDISKNSWTELHSFPIPSTDLRIPKRTRILVVEGELVVVGETGRDQFNLFVTERFRGKKKEIVWKRTNCSLSFSKFAGEPCIGSFQLW